MIYYSYVFRKVGGNTAFLQYRQIRPNTYWVLEIFLRLPVFGHLVCLLKEAVLGRESEGLGIVALRLWLLS